MSDRVAVALIDDDEAILDSLQIYLRRRGFLVFAFRSAKAFLEEIGRAPEEFDCVVTDVRMPGTTGLQLQRSLADSAPELPLIIITGHGDIDMAVRAIKAGAYDFLEKRSPLTKGALQQALPKRQDASATGPWRSAARPSLRSGTPTCPTGSGK